MAGMKIRKGDRVKVIAGKERGKEGEVMFAFPADGKVIVRGINLAKRHQKPRGAGAGQQGGIIDKDMPIDVSNVALICAKCGPTRAGYRFDAGGHKERICRKCEGVL